MPHERPPTIDPVAAARWEAAPASASPWLHEEVGRRMAERLEWIRREPQAWVDWGPVRGGLQAHAEVARRYPKSARFVVDEPSRIVAAERALARPWWKRLGGGAVEFARPPDGGAQLLWSNMALHMAPDPQAWIAQWHRALAVDGFLMFSCLGPDTVRELREVYAAQGWPPPGHAFTDMHDWGDMLVAAGFGEPVMDMERITLTYESPARLLQELRELGANLHPARFAGLRGRRWQAQLQAALASGLGDADGRLALTFEVVYGHAFKPAPRVRVAGHSAVGLQDMRAMLQGGKRANPPDS
jgi:malonyl-CoA O-methyltransferase